MDIGKGRLSGAYGNGDHFAKKHNDFDPDISNCYYLMPPRGKSADINDTELSIFDAQKYFSENVCPTEAIKSAAAEYSSVTRSSVSSVDGGYVRNLGAGSFRAKPKSSSEASWTSQTGLLTNQSGCSNRGNFPSDDRKKGGHGKKAWIFGRKCCCVGDKSVEVKEITSESNDGGAENDKGAEMARYARTSYAYGRREVDQQQIMANLNPVRSPPERPDFSVSEGSLRQRVSAHGLGGGLPVKPLSMKKTIVDPLEDPARDSIEVFQPPATRPNIPGNPRQGFNPGSPTKRVANRDDDVGSDASSDLFEIESFSTWNPMYRRRHSFEEAPKKLAAGNSGAIHYEWSSLDELQTPSIAATECYPPSEVSVSWSVTTAEGRASLSNLSASASVVGEEALFRRRPQEEIVANAERRGLLSMSCRQEKAVSVGPQPEKFVSVGGPQSFPLHIGGRPPRSYKPPHSARLSLAFAA